MMKNYTEREIDEIIWSQNQFFESGQSADIQFRLSQLKKLKSAIKENEQAIANALKSDLNKSFEESFLTEISMVLNEIDWHISHLKRWSEAQTVSTPWFLLPSSSKITYHPKGKALIIAPWNYPFQLLINPLIGAISAGCTAILKPSEHAIHTAEWIEQWIQSIFPSSYIAVITGYIPTNTYLLTKPFDIIFFTGSTVVGKIVAQAAAHHLCPVVLELGGKSPCVVDADASIDLSAQRIAWGKTINAGQTCIAPDYVLVHESIQNELIEALKNAFEKFYSSNPENNPFFPRMIHQRAAERMQYLLESVNVVYGGQCVPEKRYVAPTLVLNPDSNSRLMQEEIFGPILPIISYRTEKEASDWIKIHPKPLALYYFGNTKKAEAFIAKNPSGGACINDTIMHIANHHMPFGGIGPSGLGSYHGFESFKTFSHAKSILKSSTYFDLPMRYPPFKYFSMIKRLMSL